MFNKSERLPLSLRLVTGVDLSKILGGQTKISEERW